MIVALLLLMGAIAGGWFLYGRVSDPFRTMTPLPIPDYLENANSLQGNVYKLDAVIEKQIDASTTGGRLVAVSVEGEVLPVLVPPEFNHLNIDRGQRYYFKNEVVDKGILRAQEVKKA